jgi:hypothetical protein
VSVVAGLVFLRWRVQTKRRMMLDAMFVAASLLTMVVQFFVAAWITGEGV